MRPLIFLPLLAATAVVAQTDSSELPPVLQKISSFGACLSGEHVYLYGGHTGTAHEHSRENLSADFLRLSVRDAGAAWEELPEDRAVQGTALVAWDDLVIRIAGMYATNAPGDEAEMFSTDEIRCFDPATNSWSDWPSLPGKISSHDAYVMDDVLYVVGGWKLDGNDEGTWQKHGWSLDLNNRDTGWKNLPPMPTIRRAGTLAAAGGELWYIGGMGDEEGLSADAFAFDPATRSWREGPDLPLTSEIKAFGNDAFSVDDRLFVSGMDGVLYSLEPGTDAWATTTVSHQKGRIFHRSVPVGDGVFWTIAGASMKGHRDDIEVLPVPARFPMVADAALWPAFRGGANNGLADQKMPKAWGKKSGVAWNMELPGYGQSAPVYGYGGLFVTSSIIADEVDEPEPTPAPVENSKGGGEKGRSGVIEAAEGPMKTDVAVTRLNPDSGQIVWTATVPSSKPEPSNKYRSSAAPTPCLDEKAVYAWFESGDLVAIDHEGETLWHQNIAETYGELMGNHGIAGSVMQDEDSLYLLVDHGGPSYLLALDKATGDARWKVDREKRVSWSTPVVTDDAIIICSNGLVEERDKATGEQRWVVEDLEGNTVASPLVFANFVLAPSSDKGQTQLIGRGDRDDRVVWKTEGKLASSFASPIFSQGQIILVSKAGVASGLDWRTGEELWSHRLPAGNWATPVAAGKTVYFFSKSGATLVTRLSASGLHEMATCELDAEETVYGVIPAGERWIIRTGSEVTAIAAPKKDA